VILKKNAAAISPKREKKCLQRSEEAYREWRTKGTNASSPPPFFGKVSKVSYGKGVSKSKLCRKLFIKAKKREKEKERGKDMPREELSPDKTREWPHAKSRSGSNRSADKIPC